MTVPRRRLAARVIVLASTLILAGCVPQPEAQGSFHPVASAGPSATPRSTPVPTGPPAPPSFVRPTPTPLPTFQSYIVKPGDTLEAIARTHGTSVASLAFWNRARYPSLDPDAPEYAPDRIEAGWVLLLVPHAEIDEDSTFPE